MIEHYGPLLTSIKTMFGYKTSSFVGASIFSAISIETIIKTILHGQFMGISILLLFVTNCFFLVDWIIGSAASRKLAKNAQKEGNKEAWEKYKFRSIKISHTIFKFISLALWVILSIVISNFVAPMKWFSPFIEGLTIIPILLFVFREFISIGEGIEILNNGHKPYLFEIGEKIFDIFQFKFLKNLK